jgi:hypothetical protein
MWDLKEEITFLYYRVHFGNSVILRYLYRYVSSSKVHTHKNLPHIHSILVVFFLWGVKNTLSWDQIALCVPFILWHSWSEIQQTSPISSVFYVSWIAVLLQPYLHSSRISFLPTTSIIPNRFLCNSVQRICAKCCSEIMNTAKLGAVKAILYLRR